MPAIARWLPASYSESFSLDQVAIWFCADRYPLGNCTFSKDYNLQEMANSSRFAMFKQYTLKYVSGSRAVLKWKTVAAHYKCGENAMPWRKRLLISNLDAYQYYLAFRGSCYQSPYPLARMDDVVVFVVYNLKGLKRETGSSLFSSGSGVAQRGVWFTPADRSGRSRIRIYGVDTPKNFLEFADWGELADPTTRDRWNVLAVWWRPSGKKSSLWINYGKDHLGGKMLEFDGSKDPDGKTTTIGNDTSGDYPLNGWVANFEAYDSAHMCTDFIQARVKFLSDQYGVEDSPYVSTNLEPEPWECIDNEDGIDPREVSPEFEE